jgi:hypothetical protein
VIEERATPHLVTLGDRAEHRLAGDYR